MQDISSDDVNYPALVGAMWKMNNEVQWFFGLSANLWSDIPILPAAGARWKFADRWTLNAVFPSPRLQYELTEQWNLFLGARLLGGSYRVSQDLGTQSGQPQLNNAILSYREIRLGGGAEWKINPAMTLQLDAGYAVNRRFEYPRANDQITGEGAPYAQIGLATAF
jgi:Domain of unknown function (DUF6268)